MEIVETLFLSFQLFAHKWTRAYTASPPLAECQQQGVFNYNLR